MVHFLGGVFVSPQPENAYRYLLESLANRGYVVIATPFTVDFEYRKPAAEIHAKFTAAKALLEAEAGDARARRGSGSIASLPQFALGHSLGALMQVLLCCTYAEYAQSCTGSALLSYNNKPASEAIPAFEQLFVPALAPLEPLTRTAAYTGAIEGARALRQFGFGLARAGLERASPLLSGGGGQGGAASSSHAAAEVAAAEVASERSTARIRVKLFYSTVPVHCYCVETVSLSCFWPPESKGAPDTQLSFQESCVEVRAPYAKRSFLISQGCSPLLRAPSPRESATIGRLGGSRAGAGRHGVRGRRREATAGAVLGGPQRRQVALRSTRASAVAAKSS